MIVCLINCNQANQIPLDTVIKAMGCKVLAKHSGGEEQWYENPLRTERTPSFSVNHKKNLWQDLGTGEGGKVIDLVMQYSSTNVSGALQWLKKNLNNTPLLKNNTPCTAPQYEENKSRFEVRKVKEVQNPNLQAYATERGIHTAIVSEHLKEIRFFDTEKQKEYYALGMQNETGGYNLRNKYMKTAIAPMDFTHISGQENGNTIHIFEGFFNSLTYLTMQNQITPKDEIITLNSTKMAKRAVAYLQNDVNIAHKNLVLWLDNEAEDSKANESVEQATNHFLKLPCAVYSARENYTGYNDLNAYWMVTKQVFIPEFKPLNTPDPSQDLQFG